MVNIGSELPISDRTVVVRCLRVQEDRSNGDGSAWSSGEDRGRCCGFESRPLRGWADVPCHCGSNGGNGVAKGGVHGEIDDLELWSAMAAAAIRGTGAREEARGGKEWWRRAIAVPVLPLNRAGRGRMAGSRNLKAGHQWRPRWQVWSLRCGRELGRARQTQRAERSPRALFIGVEERRREPGRELHVQAVNGAATLTRRVRDEQIERGWVRLVGVGSVHTGAVDAGRKPGWPRRPSSAPSYSSHGGHDGGGPAWPWCCSKGEGGGRKRCGSEEGRSRRRRWRCGAEVLLGEGEGRTRCCSEQMGKKKEV